MSKAAHTLLSWRVGIIGVVVCLLVAGGWVYYRAHSQDNDSPKQWDKLTSVGVVEGEVNDYGKALSRLDTNAKKQINKQSPGASPRTEGDFSSSGRHRQPSSIDVIVNKKHPLVPLAYAPSDLVSAHGAILSAKAMGDFKAMYAAAVAAGQPFSVSSSYRSYSQQVSTYNYWVSVGGKAEADTYSARPGFSEHQTGFVVDVAAGSCRLDCFASTSQYKWFQVHAAEYGFIQRYLAGQETVTGYIAEPWHYRYVGKAVAMDMRAKGVKTLEQYWGISGGGY